MFQKISTAVYKISIFVIFIKSSLCTDFDLSDVCVMNRGGIFCQNIDIPEVKQIKGPNSASTLLIENSRIPVLSHFAMSGLDYINIKNSGVKVIKPNTFSSLNNLRLINLDHNLIEAIPDNIFNIPFLNELHLANNKIKNITSLSFYGLNSLTTLDLSNNFIANLPDEMFESIRKLKVLYLGNNQIKEVKSHEFRDLQYLRVLNLQGNYIEEMKNGTFHSNYQIEDINLSWNNLSVFEHHVLPLDLRSYNSLKYINLSHNKLKIIKTNYYGTGLLNLSYNLLDTIEINAFEFSKLEILEISNNQLKNFISSSEYLKVLNPNSIEWSELNAKKFSPFNMIKSLDLSNNNITHLEPEIFRSNQILTNLNIANNKIKNVGFLRSLCSIVNLNMSSAFEDHVNGNYVLRLLADDRKCTSKFQRLRSLDLSYNNFGEIDITLLGYASTLPKLYIAGNNLTYIDINYLRNAGFPDLQEVGLDENDWNCTFIEDLAKFFLHQNIALPHQSKTPEDSQRFGIKCVDCNENNSNHRSCSKDEDKNKSDLRSKLESNIDKTSDLETGEMFFYFRRGKIPNEIKRGLKELLFN